jgi:hypothetical protein
VVGQLAGGQLEAQVVEMTPFGAELQRSSPSVSARTLSMSIATTDSFTNQELHVIGSLWPARRIASSASFSGTPAISKSTGRA